VYGCMGDSGPKPVGAATSRSTDFVAATDPSRPSTPIHSHTHTPTHGREAPGGAVPLDSPFYIERRTDGEFREAIRRQDSIVLVKGPRQVGKTSLLARGLQGAREA